MSKLAEFSGTCYHVQVEINIKTYLRGESEGNEENYWKIIQRSSESSWSYKYLNIFVDGKNRNDYQLNWKILLHCNIDIIIVVISFYKWGSWGSQ